MPRSRRPSSWVRRPPLSSHLPRKLPVGGLVPHHDAQIGSQGRRLSGAGGSRAAGIPCTTSPATNDAGLCAEGEDPPPSRPRPLRCTGGLRRLPAALVLRRAREGFAPSERWHTREQVLRQSRASRLMWSRCGGRRGGIRRGGGWRAWPPTKGRWPSVAVAAGRETVSVRA